MATRNAKTTPIIDAEDLQEVHDWAIIETDGQSAVWEKPTTGETIRLPIGAKPTPRMIQIAVLNGAVLMQPQHHGAPSFVDDLDEEPSTSVDRVVTLLQNTVEGTRAEVKIYRMKDGDRDIYCGSFTPEQFEQGNLELIRSNFGGGKFRIKVYATNAESGKFAIRMNEQVEIEQSVLPSSLNGAQSNPMETMMRKIDALGNGNVNSQQATNPMHQLKDMLGMFVMMKQVFGGGDQPKSSVGEIAQAIREIKDLQGDLGGGGGSGGGLMEMGTEVMKMISEARQGAPMSPQTAYAPPIQRIEVRPNPVPSVRESAEPEQTPAQQDFNPPESEGDMTSMFVKMAFRVIMKKAAENAPVEPIAKDLYEKLPDEILDMLETSMWFDALKEFAPDVVNHEEWFTMLRTAVLAEIAKDSASD